MNNFQRALMIKNAANLKRVRYVATQLYMLCLQEKSGGLSFGSIEMHFKRAPSQSKQAYWGSHTGTFYKYAKGSVRIKDHSLIERIEEDEQYQGCKYILSHPLWQILENPHASIASLWEIMRTLNPTMQTRLFKFNKASNVYKRKYWTNSTHFSRLSMYNNLDALACLIILIREMELLKKWHTYVQVKWYVHDLFIRLTYFKPLSSIHLELYALIYTHFLAKNNPITADYFSFEKQDVYQHFKSYFKSPNLIDDFSLFHRLLKQTLLHAKKVINIGDTKEAQLDFLFWVSEHNLLKVHRSFNEFQTTAQQPPLIKKLIKACSDPNTRRHINSSEFLNI